MQEKKSFDFFRHMEAKRKNEEKEGKTFFFREKDEKKKEQLTK